jgi:nucleoside triphosphatase
MNHPSESTHDWRTIVVGVIQNARDEYLICRKPTNRGVFPGQWALPGGGIEPGERMEDAFRREVKEEVGLEIRHIQPLFFKDGQYPKLYPDGSSRLIYMIFLVFSCQACSEDVTIGEEFEAYAWVKKEDLAAYDLNQETRDTLIQMGAFTPPGPRPETSTQHTREAVDAFWENIPPFWQRIRGHIRQEAAEQFEISVEQFHILRHIRRGQGSVSELAEARNSSRAAASQAVEALVQRGMVTRTTDLRDRRHVRLSLTATGDALLDAVFDDTRLWMMQMLAPLSDEELHTLAQAMNSLAKTQPE